MKSIEEMLSRNVFSSLQQCGIAQTRSRTNFLGSLSSKRASFSTFGKQNFEITHKVTLNSQERFETLLSKGKSTDVSSFRRAFWSPTATNLWKPDIKTLTLEADANPEDAVAQEHLLRAMLTIDPKSIIARYENKAFRMNDNCKEIYLQAALKVHQEGKTPTPVQVMLVSSKRDRVLSTVQFLLGLCVPACIFVMLYMYIDEERKANDNETPISKAHILSPAVSQRFSDVKGVDEAKQDLQEVVEYLKNPEKFTRLGAKLPKGVLLVGDPGTGKTLLSRAVAGEAGVPFLYVSGSAFDEMFVGVGPRRVRDLFDDARKMAPCIIFIDELDAVGVARKYSMSGSHAKESTLNQLLTEMDGFKQSEGIIVVAATNLPETLDPALTRPGRFDKQVTVPAPDIVGRKEILDLYLAKTKTHNDVSSEMIARSTTGFSGAELSNLVNLAAIKAAVSGASHVDMRSIEEARDDIIMGGKKRGGMVQTEADKRVTAYHEGGHALVALYSEGAHPIHKATIIQRGNALGVVSFLPERDELSVSKRQMLSRLRVAMGGRAGEAVAFGEADVTTGASSDFANATNLARHMVSKLGFSEKVGQVFHDGSHKVSEKELELIDSEVKGLLTKSYEDAKKILRDHRTELDRLASSLLEHETLSAEEIKLVISGKKLEKHVVPNLGGSEAKESKPIDLPIRGRTVVLAKESNNQ